MFIAKSVQDIIYAMYRISVNYSIAVETTVVYANSQFPSFLADEQDREIVLRCAGLNPAFYQVFLQVILHFLQFLFIYFLQPMMIYRFFRV